MTTIFMLRDMRNGSSFRIVTRELYKKAVRVHNACGQPFHVGTSYQEGHTVKSLTLMADRTVQRPLPARISERPDGIVTIDGKDYILDLKMVP